MSNFGISLSAAKASCEPKRLTHIESKVVYFMSRSELFVIETAGSSLVDAAHAGIVGAGSKGAHSSSAALV